MKNQKRQYYSLVQNENEADLNIYGDITSCPWLESDVSAYNLSQKLSEMQGVDLINVYINSYGGEVAEGLAIYNALKRHQAAVATYCDGFACSIASVIFMAGDERIMSPASLLMIHNPWLTMSGNPDQLRQAANDLDIMAQASIAAYMTGATITEDAIKSLMDAETWMTPQDAVDMGFATAIVEEDQGAAVSQSAQRIIFESLTKNPKGVVANVKVDADEFAESIVRGIAGELEKFIIKQKDNVPDEPIDPPPNEPPTEPTEPPQTEPTADQMVERFFNALNQN